VRQPAHSPKSGQAAEELFIRHIHAINSQIQLRNADALRRTLSVWVLSAPAKRWTAALQPKEFDSPVLRISRSAKMGLRY